MKDKIEFSEFIEIEKKLEIRYGTIKIVERINNKMLKLSVDFNEEELRIVITNIGNKVDRPEWLVGQSLPFITNLVPATISGFESTAMIMIAEDDDGNMQWPTVGIKEGSKLL